MNNLESLSMSGSSGERAGALYIHVPYCITKCAYCDFYSNPLGLTDPTHNFDILDRYGKAIAKELAYHGLSGVSNPDGLNSIYIGGGTPTFLSEGALADILSGASSAFRLRPGAEVTVEANPGTVNSSKLALLRDMGVNRLSIGIQSFADDELAILGRRHTAAEAVEAVRLAQALGYSNISIDLIYGLPGQTLESWLKNLSYAVSLGVQHISAYCLTIEDNTPLAEAISKGYLPKIDDDRAADMMDATVDTFGQAGYFRYEISNYSLEGYRSVHNQAYWNYEPYIGAGAGAVGFDGRCRYTNTRDDIGYINSWEEGKPSLKITEVLTDNERMSEAAFLGLRKADGIDIDLWEMKFGRSFSEVYGKAVEVIISRGLGALTEKRGPLPGRSFRLTDAGMSISNSLALDFLL